MWVELNKRDILRLIKGTEPSCEAMQLIPENLGEYVGGFIDRWEWKIGTRVSDDELYPEYSEEYLWDLYKKSIDKADSLEKQQCTRSDIELLSAVDDIENMLHKQKDMTYKEKQIADIVQGNAEDIAKFRKNFASILVNMNKKDMMPVLMDLLEGLKPDVKLGDLTEQVCEKYGIDIINEEDIRKAEEQLK